MIKTTTFLLGGNGGDSVSPPGLAAIFMPYQSLGRVSDGGEAGRVPSYAGPLPIMLIGRLLMSGALLDPTVI